MTFPIETCALYITIPASNVGDARTGLYIEAARNAKALFDEFLAPFYRKVIPVIHEYGIPVFIDSDGDITMAVDWYASVGADGMLPLERQAGVDVSLYIDKQPDMVFLGHFDKMCIRDAGVCHKSSIYRYHIRQVQSNCKGRRFLSTGYCGQKRQLHKITDKTHEKQLKLCVNRDIMKQNMR